MDGKRAGKLLLVEDEHLLRCLIAQFLRGEGFEIVEAADGHQGVTFFTSRGPFDLVLLDLNLPIMSGVDVCRRIKSEQPLQPVIICSAAILENHVVALQALEVDQYLTKPYHPGELLNRIARELSRGRVLEDEADEDPRVIAEPIRGVDLRCGARPHRPYPGQAAAVGLR
jgi:two-component system phosphate regulon response regulator PhoB